MDLLDTIVATIQLYKLGDLPEAVVVKYLMQYLDNYSKQFKDANPKSTEKESTKKEIKSIL